MATGESLSLREILDDRLSDQWAKQSGTGLKLDEVFLIGDNALMEHTPAWPRPGDGVMRFRIEIERFERKKEDF